MSNEHASEKSAAQIPPAEIPPYVHLFQKAHQNIGLLERIDEQLAQLWEKRHELQEELRMLQTQINSELEDRIHAAGEPPQQILNAVMGADRFGADQVGGERPASDATLPPIAMRANRFATQPLTVAAEE